MQFHCRVCGICFHQTLINLVSDYVLHSEITLWDSPHTTEWPFTARMMINSPNKQLPSKLSSDKCDFLRCWQSYKMFIFYKSNNHINKAVLRNFRTSIWVTVLVIIWPFSHLHFLVFSLSGHYQKSVGHALNKLKWQACSSASICAYTHTGRNSCFIEINWLDFLHNSQSSWVEVNTYFFHTFWGWYMFVGVT